jgi:hypothetical protein|tara:strand:+ start:329 stop:532 length:204 start_codon:yes stop_codon:yes gene_type:complete
MTHTNYPTESDYKPTEGTFELEFRNRLEFFRPSHRKMICDNFTLRHSLMEDDYKTVLHDMISLKIIK